jgi:hypothetical protein
MDWVTLSRHCTTVDDVRSETRLGRGAAADAIRDLARMLDPQLDTELPDIEALWSDVRDRCLLAAARNGAAPSASGLVGVESAGGTVAAADFENRDYLGVLNAVLTILEGHWGLLLVRCSCVEEVAEVVAELAGSTAVSLDDCVDGLRLLAEMRQIPHCYVLSPEDLWQRMRPAPPDSFGFPRLPGERGRKGIPPLDELTWLTINAAVDGAAATFQLCREEVKDHNDRRRPVARARQVAMLVCTEFFGVPIQHVGKEFDRDWGPLRYQLRNFMESSAAEYRQEIEAVRLAVERARAAMSGQVDRQ